MGIALQAAGKTVQGHSFLQLSNQD
ncbi:hypothetical protein [Gloeobacter kilaueensis]